MRLIKAEVKNFACYTNVILDYENRGLTLISGPTGSGKSTICDIAPWILYGITAKGGAVDEIRNWDNNKPTVGELTVDINGVEWQIYRRRDTKGNDLYYHQLGKDSVRGKDLNDTQTQLNSILGADSTAYLASAYFHEFSQVAGFFTATAKARRGITEQLADLALSKKLMEKITAKKRQLKTDKEVIDKDLAVSLSEIEYLTKHYNLEMDKKRRWRLDNIAAVAQNTRLAESFDEVKTKNLKALEIAHTNAIIEAAYDLEKLESSLKPPEYFIAEISKLEGKLEALSEHTCPECGALKDTQAKMLLTKAKYTLELEQEKNKQIQINIVRIQQSLEAKALVYGRNMQKEKDTVNVYVDRVKELKAQKNPHSIKAILQNLSKTKLELHTTNEWHQAVCTELSDLELLTQVNDTLRSSCIANTIKLLQNETNKLLETYFDSEFQVKFDPDAKDKLEVTITKNASECYYTQLSKGQRQLLKLCFGISVMNAVSNYNGTNFNCLWFDEALDGLDETMKDKAFNLINNVFIGHESVFVIDHSESLKSRFENRIHVVMNNGEATIEAV